MEQHDHADLRPKPQHHREVVNLPHSSAPPASCCPPAPGSPQRPLQIHVWTYKNALLSSVSRASLEKKTRSLKTPPQTLLMRRWSILSGWIPGRMLGPAVPATHNSPDWTFLIIHENAERLRLMLKSPQFRVMLCTRVGVFFCLLAEIRGYSDQQLLSRFWSRSWFPRAACWIMQPSSESRHSSACVRSNQRYDTSEVRKEQKRK